MLLVMAPIAIFVPNQAEFGGAISTLLPLLFAGAVALLLMVGIAWVSHTFREKVAYALFFAGVFLWLKEILVPLQWGALDGGEKLHLSWMRVAVEGGLALLAFAAWYNLSKTIVARIALPFIIVLVASQVSYLFINLEKADQTRANLGLKAAAALPGNDRPNIYHLVFDAYSSLNFGKRLASRELQRTYRSFSFYPNNLSNYVATSGSVASFMTGTVYGEGTFADWQETARTSGLRKVLKDNGYRIFEYVPDAEHAWSFRHADFRRTSRSIAKISDPLTEPALLAQLAMVRSAPEVIRSDIYAISDRMFGRLTGLGERFSWSKFNNRLSVPLFEQLLEDEQVRPGRGVYVYAHLLLPHEPFLWGPQCQASGQSSYEQQAVCADGLIERLLEKLRRAGRLEDSLIIIHGDHGYQGEFGDGRNGGLMPQQALADAIRQEFTFVSLEGFVAKLQSLLLIKRPGEPDRPLQVAETPTQLLDVPATILDAVQLTGGLGDGKSIFKLDAAGNRQRHVYSGIFAKDKNGRQIVLGKQVMRASLTHLSYSMKSGWRVHKAVPARYK